MFRALWTVLFFPPYGCYQIMLIIWMHKNNFYLFLQQPYEIRLFIYIFMVIKWSHKTWKWNKCNFLPNKWDFLVKLKHGRHIVWLYTFKK